MKNTIKKVFISAIVLLAFLSISIPMYAIYKYNLPDIEIQSELRISARDISKIEAVLDYQKNKLTRLFGKMPKGKIKLYFFASTAAFTQKMNTTWQVGGIYSHNTIYLQPISSLKKRKSFETLLKHEYSHHFFEKRFDDLPVFLNEGLSAFYSGLIIEHSLPMLYANITNNSDEIFKNPVILNRYLYSARSFVGYILDKKGIDGLRKILKSGNTKIIKKLYLTYYFEHSPKIRVLLRPITKKRFVVSTHDKVFSAVLYKHNSTNTIAIRGNIQIEIADGQIYINDRPVSRVMLKFNSGFTVNKKSLRGYLEIRFDDKELLLINRLPVEYYLYSVVNSEMPVNTIAHNITACDIIACDIIALKTQAVLSRSWAYYRIKQRQNEVYDVSVFTIDQSYKGRSWERKYSRKAVRETEGEVVKFQGKVVLPYYSSTCGGHTANTEDVWHNVVPYIRSVECRLSNTDLCAKSPHYSEWTNTVSKKELANIFDMQIYSLAIHETNQHGRAKSILLNGQTIGFEEFKRKIAKVKGWFILKSAVFAIEEKEGFYMFCGRGLGHGVGLCQYGAIELAKRGWSYKQIIDFYYDEVEVLPIEVEDME